MMRDHGPITSHERPFQETGQSSDPMFELLDATGEDVVAIRVGAGTPGGYRELYEMLSDVSDDYGIVHVYEETPDWTVRTYLSHWDGIVPDPRLGPEFDIGRYAAVGDGFWVRLLYHQWRAIAPIWPVSPDEMRHFAVDDRRRALAWVQTGRERSATSGSESESR